MPHYRLYYMDMEGAIDSVDEFSARDDVEAVRISKDGSQPRPHELWCRARLVAERKGSPVACLINRR